MVDNGVSKQEASQAKRLASIRAKQELQRQQKTVVAEALSAIKLPGSKPNHIVFESDSSDNETAPLKAKVTKKVDLFGGSDDECPNLEEENPDILISNKLKGKSAEKLTKLQMTYGGDDRFKLDNTFLDEKEKVDEDEFEMEQEKERQLRLLSMVVGRDIPVKHSATKAQAAAMPFQRFDPFNPEHIAWMKAQKKNEHEVEDLPKSELKEVEKPIPIVDERRFFSIDEDFVNELRAKIAEGKKESFTFLKKEEPKSKKFDEDEDEEDKEPKESKEENMEVEDKATTSKAKMTTVKLRTGVNPSFFFQARDPAIQSKLQRFCLLRSRDVEKKKWQTFRVAFWKNARNIRRQNARKKDADRNMPNLYELLGCGNQATTDQVLAEYRAKVISAHPDKFPDGEKEKAQEKFRELQYAKEILCDPSKRRHYDAYLALGSVMPLQEWMENQEKFQQNMHWVTNTSSPQMIESSSKSDPVNSTRFEGWTRHESPTISAFRKYQI